MKKDVLFTAPPHARRCHNILFYIFRELTRVETDGPLPRRPVSIGSDRVRLPTFSTLSLYYDNNDSNDDNNNNYNYKDFIKRGLTLNS